MVKNILCKITLLYINVIYTIIQCVYLGFYEPPRDTMQRYTNLYSDYTGPIVTVPLHGDNTQSAYCVYVHVLHGVQLHCMTVIMHKPSLWCIS